MNKSFRILVAIGAFCAAQSGLAQTNVPASMNRAAQIAHARQANAALMHQYTWTTRTEIMVNDQIKDTRIEQVSFGPNGQLQRNLVNDQPASGFYLPTPIGFLRRAIAANEKEQMETFLKGLKGMLEQYTLPTTGKILDFIMSAKPSGPDPNGFFLLSGNNVVQQGDSLTLWVNAWTQHLHQVKVNTTFQGSAVELTATFALVPGSGLSYAAYGEAVVPDKQLSVKVQNYNYARLGY